MNLISREVEDPMFDPMFPESKANPRTITVKVSLASDPVRRMHMRGDLDDAQNETCKYFYAQFQKAHTGPHGIDFEKPVVDSQPGLNGAQGANMEASEALKQARHELGRKPFDMICLVAGEAYAVNDAAHIMLGRAPLPAEKTFYGKFFRDSVDCLAKFWGFR